MRGEPPKVPVRVLIADDDTEFTKAMFTALAADGRIDVAGTARDGVEALELSKTLRPDVVLLDLEMPRMDGYEALRRLNRRVRRPAVIVLTGVTEQQDLARAARLNPDALLEKTVDAETIVPSVVFALVLAKARAA